MSDERKFQLYQIDVSNYEVLEKLMDKVEIPFFINDAVYNAIEDLVVNLTRCNPVKVAELLSSLED